MTTRRHFFSFWFTWVNTLFGELIFKFMVQGKTILNSRGIIIFV